jgi:hypothetical protein
VLAELRELLIGEELTDGVNLHLSEVDGTVQVHLMAVDVRRLGLLLAVLSDPAELSDPDSLSNRITPGDKGGDHGRWQYGLAATRYPAGGEIVFSGKVRLPASDLPEVIARLGRSGAA